MIQDLLRKLEAHSAVEQLLDRVRAGERSVSLSGLSGSSRGMLAALLHARLRRPLIVITADNARAESLAADTRYFLAHLDPAAGECLSLPAVDVDPYRGFSPHPTLAQQRASTLWTLTRGGAAVLALSARSLLWRLPSPTEVAGEGLVLHRGAWLDPERLIAQLTDFGYALEDPVTEVGEYSRRGGIVDIFPPTSDYPLRLEFDGDEIVSIRAYDPDTQRSVAESEAATLSPLRETGLNADVLERWADRAQELWSGRAYYSRLEPQIVQARQGERFAGIEFLLPILSPMNASLPDYLPSAVVLLDEPDALTSDMAEFRERLSQRFEEVGGMEAPVPEPASFVWEPQWMQERLRRGVCISLHELELQDGEPADRSWHLATQPVRHYKGMIRDLLADLERSHEQGERLILLSSSLGRAERLQELLLQNDIPVHLQGPGRADAAKAPDPAPGTEDDDARRPVFLGVGDLAAGFRLPELEWTLLASPEIFGESEALAQRKGRRRGARGTAFFSDFRDLKVGDYVVHVDHGIGQFQGMFQMGVGDRMRDFVLLHYRNEARLYVPVERLDLIEKYSSVGGARPTLDQLGGGSWQKTKSRIRKSMRDMAEELLRLYAQRNLAEGFRFSADGPWQREFEEAFEYQETPDQLTSLEEVKRDMEGGRPMDRLLCGDVGYGKTEIAIRAAFKAVMDGKQVSLLAPTTVLAFQHYNTFVERFRAFPVQIALLSRFRSVKEQKEVVTDLEMGKIDIVIGTHRLLSKDVKFKDLGLVVVDEEQRFGVTHKERLKQLRTRVDVLTMTATPIPRTLHMSMMGIRDMSVIETPPKDRLAIQTAVVKFNTDLIKAAIDMELSRQGQVYLVHNRVESIYSMAALVQRLCPQARVTVGHGQMAEKQLEDVMMKFMRHETDVLVATTIVENGLDIPLVNTILINRADRYGLSQLYQLRGRVGRSSRRAYAYLLIPSEETLSDVARRRLAAIREFSDLGAGFRVAALDLEIRGAGNLLGANQHGHINTIGFDLYCQLLERTVAELKGEEIEQEVQTAINLELDIRIPEAYVADTQQRLRLYKRIASSRSDEQLTALRAEIVDRYGPAPPQLDNLFAYAELRQLAGRVGVSAIESKEGRIHIKFAGNGDLDPRRLLELIHCQPGASFSPGGTLSVDRTGEGAELVVQARNLLQMVS